MKALRWHGPDRPCAIEEIADPVPRAGAVLVRQRAAPVLSYMRRVLSGELNYAMPAPPFTPGTGGVGVIEAVGPEVMHLKPGGLVSLDPRLLARDNVAEPAAILIGLTRMSADSGPLQAAWPDGSFAEKVLMPAECLTPLDALAHIEPARLVCLGKFPVAFGGLRRGELEAGQTLIVNGATGSLGSAGVLLGLALGAARIVALGRDRARLARYAGLADSRIVTVPLTGIAADDEPAVRAATAGGADMALDLVGNAADPVATLAALRALKRRGRLVLMGSMTTPLPLTYGEVMTRDLEIRGAFMYPRDTMARLAALVAAGLLDLNAVELFRHPLADFDAAFTRAAGARGLQTVALTMD
jgi:alcohol dehydrogenase